MTTTRRILVWAGPLLALVVLGAVVLHWWLDVADAREAYEAKLEALRAAGEPVTWEDFTRPLPPEEENAAPILTEVYEAYERAFPDYPGPLDHLMYLNLEEELSPEQKADLEAWAPTVDALVERLREAARLPRLAFGGSAAFYEDDESAGIATRAEHLLSSWAQYRKETATTAAEALLALTAAYEPRGFLDLIGRHLMLYGALDIFARDISAGRDVPAAARQRMVASLRRIEETVLPDRRLFVREHRAWIVAAVDWEVSGDPPENLAVADEQITPYGGLHLRAALYREAHAILEEVDAELEATSSIRHLFPPPLRPGQEGKPRLLQGLRIHDRLRMLFALDVAAARLGRWALVLDARRAAGAPLPVDPHAYAEDFPEGLPLDPCTDRPFPMRLTKEGAIWIGIDLPAAPQAVRDSLAADQLVDHRLAWEIPTR